MSVSELPRTGRMRKVILCDLKKCNGCQVCEVVCAYTKDKALNPRQSRIRVVRIEPFLNVAISCRKCERPTCVKACPRNGIVALEDGSISIDRDKCNGCGWCIESCEFGALKLHLDTKIAVVCDFCKDSSELQCVRFCPKGALSFITLEQAARRSSKEAVSYLLAELTPAPT